MMKSLEFGLESYGTDEIEIKFKEDLIYFI